MKTLLATSVLVLLCATRVHAIPLMPASTTPQTPGEQAVADVIPSTSKLHGWVGKVVDTLEQYRLRELAYFTALLDQSQHKLGLTTINDIKAVFGASDTSAKGDHTMEYITLGYAMAGKAFFARTVLYYVTVILLTLFAIRFIVTRFI